MLTSFEGCSKLTKIIIPESVKNIGILSFDGCKKLREITMNLLHQLANLLFKIVLLLNEL